MKIINCLLLLLIFISLLGFSSAYQTFSISRERFDVDNAVILVDLDSSSIIKQETLIKLYPDQIKKYGYSELVDYITNVNPKVNTFMIYNEDKTALSMADEIIKETGISLAINLGKSSIENENVLNNKKEDTKGLTSITSGSLINPNNGDSTIKPYTLIFIGTFVLIILIIFIGKKIGHF